jgi:hypothetical protein
VRVAMLGRVFWRVGVRMVEFIIRGHALCVRGSQVVAQVRDEQVQKTLAAVVARLGGDRNKSLGCA